MGFGTISWSNCQEKRALLGEKLKIGYTNGKQLYNRLNLFQITPEKLRDALEETEGRKNEK